MHQTLADLKEGSRAVVRGFLKGSAPYRKRLMSMGLTPDTDLRVIRVAPMGDPVEIMVRDYSLSLRKDEARALIVREI